MPKASNSERRKTPAALGVGPPQLGLGDVAPELAGGAEAGGDPGEGPVAAVADDDQLEVGPAVEQAGEDRQDPVEPLAGLGQVADEEELRLAGGGPGRYWSVVQPLAT